MTLKSLFSKDSMFRESCSRRIWITIPSLAGFLLTITLPIVMAIQNYKNYYGSLADDQGYTGKSILGFLSIGNFMSTTVLIIMAILGGLGLFYYLHSRQETDFYHSLPISRGKLFMINYWTVPIIVIPCYLLNILLGMAVTAATGFSSYIEPSIILYGLFQNIIFFLLIYSIAVLSAIVCGNRIISALLLIWLYFSGTALYFILDAFLSDSLQTYVTSSYYSIAKNTSPIVKLYGLINQGDQTIGSKIGWESTWIHNNIPAILICALIFAAVSVLCYVLFRIRSSESAGNALAFSKSQLPIKVYMVVVVALAGSVIVGGIMGMDFLWVIIGAAIGGILMHCIVEGIYAFDIRAIFHHLRHLILCGVIIVVILGGIKFDILGYDTKTVKLDQIQSVEFVNSDRNNYGFYSNSGTNARLTDKDSIEKVWKIANACVSASDQKEDDKYYVDYKIRFHLKSGGTMVRRYSVNDKTAKELGEELTYSEAYAEEYHPLYTTNLGENGMTLTVQSYYTNNGSGEAVITDKKIIQQIWETAREEYRSVGMDYFINHVPIASMTTSNSCVAIYPAYTKTLELIYANSNYKDYIFSGSDVKTIQITYYTGDSDIYAEEGKSIKNSDEGAMSSLYAEVTDFNDIQQLLKNLIPNEAVYGGEYTLGTIHNVDFYVEMKDGNSFDGTYQSGKEPTDLLKKYRALASSNG